MPTTPPNFLASGNYLLQSPNSNFPNAPAYLQSANGLFNAVVLPNGTFAVFRGSGPGSGAIGNSGSLWTSGDLTAGTPGQYYLAMQPDGNLVLYAGTPPYTSSTSHLWDTDTSNPPAPAAAPFYLVLNNDGSMAVMCGSSPSMTSSVQVWSPTGNPSDPLTSFNVTSLQYLPSATPGEIQGTFQENQPVQAFSTHYANGTGVAQNVLFIYTALLQTVSSWQLTTGVSIQVTSGIEVTTPVLVKGKLEVQVAFKLDFQIAKSVTTSTTKTVQAPIQVPANTLVKADFVITNANINVPFTMIGQATLKSGASFPVTLTGNYVGVQDLRVDAKISSEPYTGPTHFPLDGSVLVDPYGSAAVAAAAGSL